MGELNSIVRMEYEQSFEPKYDDETEKEKEIDPFDIVDYYYDMQNN